ncbi:unnamed protein product [Mytilus edulis]|uniref:SUEL-type lectin domain-containing protein n=1 Tax=Mytilus edulis TaxID=6550 RepID=A0A8S3UEN5_MYTED|nr:unnamed protein product [Mytilus edulis]
MLNEIYFVLLTWQISSGSEQNLTLCNERYKTLGCEPNYIYIIDVFYGRDNNLIYQPRSHSYCSSNKTENIIRQKCDGKSVCDVSVYPVVLQGSNCGYANPYLRLRYKCRKSELSVTTANPSSVNLRKTDSSSITVTGKTSEKNIISIYWKIYMLSCGAVLLVLISIAIFRLKPCRKKMKPAEITESKTAATDV